MDNDPKYIIIGSVVVVICTALAIFLLWSADVSTESSTITYDVIFKEHSPVGLQKDAPVLMKGIKIGTVHSVSFDPNDVEKVKVELHVRGDAPVKTDTKAVIRNNLITGLASIGLVDSTKDAPLLRKSKQSMLIIPEGTTPLEEITHSLPKIISNTSQLVTQLEDFFSKENSQSTTEILKNIDIITTNLSNNSNQINKTIDSVYKASIALNELTTDLKSDINQITEQTKQITSRSEKLIKRADTKLEETSNSVIETTQSIKQGKERILGATERNLLN